MDSKEKQESRQKNEHYQNCKKVQFFQKEFKKKRTTTRKLSYLITDFFTIFFVFYKVDYYPSVVVRTEKA